MAYIRYKEVTKHFNFSKVVELKSLPSYVSDYAYDSETILAAYKVGRDHGMITDKKIVLFDKSISFRPKKEITTIPYRSISAHSVIFHNNTAEIYLLLDSGHPLLLKFSNMSAEDKVRLRLLYNAMSSIICGEKIPNTILKKLLDKDFSIKTKNKED